MNKKRVLFPLTVKLSLIILVIVIAVGGATTYLLSRDIRTLLFTTENQKLQTTLVEQTHEVKLLLDSGKILASQISTASGVMRYMSNPKRQDQDPVLLAEFNTYPLAEEVSNVYLMDTTGRTILTVDPAFLNMNYSFRNYFKQSITGNNAVESAIGISTKEFGIYFSSPIYFQGKIIGVAVVKIDPSRVFTSLDESYLSTLGYLMMVDRNGVIVHSNKPNTLYKSLGPLNESTLKNIASDKTYLQREIPSLQYLRAQQQVESGTQFSTETIYDQTDKINETLGISKVDNYPFYLVEEENLGIVEGNISGLINRLVTLLAVITAAGGIIMTLTVAWMLRPLRKLSHYVERVSEGSLEEKLVVKTDDELGLLAEGVETMVGALKSYSGNLEKKVTEKTLELQNTLGLVETKNKNLEEARLAMLNVLEDLDAEKNKIANDRNRLETILTSIGDAVLVVDAEGKITMMNNVAQSMCGYTVYEALGKNYTEIFKLSLENNPEAVFPRAVDIAMSTGKVATMPLNTVLTSKDGRQIPILDSAAPLKDIDGKIFGCVVVMRDNTKERELERSKDEFLSVASHQLRTPLGSIRWNLELLLAGDYGEITGDARTAANQIHDGTLRMIALVNDLLNVSRIDQGRVMDEPVETNLGNIVKQKTGDLKMLADREKVEMSVNVAENLPNVVIDPKRFGEVITNLVSNSIKYHKENGWVKIELNMTDDKFKLTIADNGIGIPKKDEGRLFEKFYRADNAVKSQTEGSGLGLYIAKKFIEGWGGSITAESEEGQGTTFTIYLPKDIKRIKQEEKV